jgi:phospholipid-binding lipoprotein MlaA
MHKLLLSVIWVVLLTGGCTAARNASNGNDPWEGLNRGMYRVNDSIDRFILYPVANAYASYTPALVRTSLNNFFENVVYPNVVLNDVLQGKFIQGVEDSGRFLVNSSLGIFGFFDLATPLGIPAHDEDLGQTFGVWGLGEGAYLVLPLLGPDSLRDIPDWAVRIFFTNLTFLAPNSWSIPLTALKIIDTRSRLPSPEELDKLALDPYIFTREAYRQRRNFLIYDGAPPLEEFEGHNSGSAPEEEMPAGEQVQGGGSLDEDLAPSLSRSP